MRTLQLVAQIKLLNIDLHCHTTASDGNLTPTELVNRAIEKGVDVLAITDHDNFDAYDEAKQAAGGKIKLIPGIEFSSVWNGIGIHIVGLDFDPQLLQEAVAKQKLAREARTLKIAERLEKLGVKNALAGGKRFATSETVGRPHFAKFLVAEGYFATEEEAFKKWLCKSNIGNVKTSWPGIETVVGYITAAKGHAVVAHPHQYKMTNSKLGKFLSAFKACGGAGMEVCATGINPQTQAYFSDLCQRHQLMGSRGSDFHTPSNAWTELGRVATLPNNVVPIWNVFKL